MGRAMAFSFDAVDPAAPDSWFDAVAERMGVPAFLFYNAGISLRARAHKATLDDFEQTMAVNVRALWRLSQLCAARWIKAGTQDCIVNISSMLSGKPIRAAPNRPNCRPGPDLRLGLGLRPDRSRQETPGA
ncbi:SDR family NAD(P)-dependent oxidoreductase [Citreicella sp. C3M06]|uniref:SDR family NAD(P)-dependent oxidoreductase n=1 Tax=Citreicella sp. C3M06 TaxID=2841564 RepID=UPI00352F6986